MNKSLRKMNLYGPKSKSSAASYKNPKVYSPYANKKNFYKKILSQIALCIVIVLLVILIKNINTPLTNKTETLIETSLKQEFDINNSMKKVIKYVKEIPEIPKRVVNVFNSFEERSDSYMNMIPPINGEIISYFGESTDPILNQKTFQRGIDILVTEDQEVKSIADGEIVEVGLGSSLGQYIKIMHDDELFSIYGNCTTIAVEQGQKVKQGQTIAEINFDSKEVSPHFHFELWMKGNVVDPMKYIQFGKRIL